MSGYYDDTQWRGAGGAGPPPQGGPVHVNAGRLWAAGFATGVVAALIALVGVLVVRAVSEVALYAPSDASAFGDRDTGVLCAIAFLAALAATGLVHVLLLATPRPLSYFGWIVGLVTVAAVVVPFLSADSTGVAVAMAVIHLAIGVAIGTLVAGAARTASRGGQDRRRFEIE